jgi:hypothetical protein
MAQTITTHTVRCDIRPDLADHEFVRPDYLRGEIVGTFETIAQALACAVTVLAALRAPADARVTPLRFAEFQTGEGSWAQVGIWTESRLQA